MRPHATKSRQCYVGPIAKAVPPPTPDPTTLTTLSRTGGLNNCTINILNIRQQRTRVLNREALLTVKAGANKSENGDPAHEPKDEAMKEETRTMNSGGNSIYSTEIWSHHEEQRKVR